MLGLGHSKTYVIDFATLADGRVAGIMSSGLIAGRVIVPDLELYQDAHHSQVERAKTTIARLREQKDLRVRTVRVKLEGEELVKTIRRNNARLITAGDGKSLPGEIPVTTIDAMYEALRPVYLPGTEILVKIVKKGKEEDEGIGYLEGGVKVVVENGGGSSGKEVEVVILGALDTAVGRVVFARPKYTEVR